MSVNTMRGVSAAEIAKFRQLKDHWWDPNGPLRTLHAFNPVRVDYINNACKHFSRGSNFLNPIGIRQGMSVLDVGCGGGVLSESLARLGGNVLGIDMCEESVNVAKSRRERILRDTAALFHTKSNHEVGSSTLDYQYISLNDLVEKEKKQFDLVIASEVIEHVDHASGFVKDLCCATKPGGLLIISTMDKSFITAFSHILVAEYISGLVKPGTHDWTKFVPPKDLTSHALLHQVRNVDLQYIVTFPDLMKSIATRQLQINFSLSSRINTGHYFWTGVKMPAPKGDSN